MSVTRTRFSVTAYTKLGETVWLSGDSAALGQWNPLKVRRSLESLAANYAVVSPTRPPFGRRDPQAIPLYTSPEEYPIWHTKHPVVLASGKEDVDFMFAVFSGGECSRKKDEIFFVRLLSQNH